MKKVPGDPYLQKTHFATQNKDEMRERGMGNGEWGTGNGELGTKLMNDRIKHFTNANNAFLESF